MTFDCSNRPVFSFTWVYESTLRYANEGTSISYYHYYTCLSSQKSKYVSFKVFNLMFLSVIYYMSYFMSTNILK